MAPRIQARDSVTGSARILEIDETTNELSVLPAAGGAPLVQVQSSIVWPLGGQFRLEENGGVGEVNGWGTIGPLDDSNTQDLGNVGQTNLARTAGGLVFPFAVNLKRFYAWHRNSNADALAWGWVIFHQQKTAGANTRTTTYVLDEVADNGGTGPRNYGNNTNQLADIDLTVLPAGQNIPAGNVIGLAVAAPTANTVNLRTVQVMGGYIELERV